MKILVLYSEEGYATVHAYDCECPEAEEETDDEVEGEAADIRQAIEIAYDLDDPEVNYQDAFSWTTFAECASLPRALGRPPKDRRLLAVKIPFDPQAAEDFEILAKVAGRKLVWINSISGEQESARVAAEDYRNPKTGSAPAAYTHISYSSEGRRILTFVDQAGTGYRSVGVDSIVQVAR